MITEAIVLAGGLGTTVKTGRSRSSQESRSCCRQTLSCPICWTTQKNRGFKKFVFALGYKTEQIETFVKKSFAGRIIYFFDRRRTTGNRRSYL